MKKMPWDAKIIGFWAFFAAAIAMFFAVLLFLGIGKFTNVEHRRIFLGLIYISSELSFGVYFLILGLINLVCGYGLLYGFKFGWWCTLAYSVNLICDSLLLTSDYSNEKIMCICVGIGIIIWLFWRRRIYNINS